jgi:hypothetical protein
MGADLVELVEVEQREGEAVAEGVLGHLVAAVAEPALVDG